MKWKGAIQNVIHIIIIITVTRIYMHMQRKAHRRLTLRNMYSNLQNERPGLLLGSRSRRSIIL